MLTQHGIVFLQFQSLVVVAPVLGSQIKMMALCAAHLHKLTRSSLGHFRLRFIFWGRGIHYFLVKTDTLTTVYNPEKAPFWVTGRDLVGESGMLPSLEHKGHRRGL